MRNAPYLPLLALLCLVLSACGGGASGADIPLAPGTTRLKVYVTDAPFPGDLVKSATVTIKQVKEIAEAKMKDLNANDIDAAMQIILGSARSMGIEVKG